MAVAGTVLLHNKFKKYIGDGTVDLTGDTFKLALFLSTSNVSDVSIDGYAAATNEHATANGYTIGGIALTSVTYNEAAGTVTFTSDDVVWTASGGSIVARYGAIYDNSVVAPVAKPILAHFLLDSTPADVTVTDTNTLTYSLTAAGAFQAN